MADSLPVYRLRQVSKLREKGGHAFELTVNSLDIFAGDFVAVVGPSGCGKSTLLDLLALVLTPSSAEQFSISAGESQSFAVAGKNDVELAEFRKRNLGYILQTGGLLPFLSVWENVLLPSLINGDGATGKTKALELLGSLQIEEQRNKKPQFLSGGQRQRVAIARALVHSPSIVLADEPTAAVDRDTALEILDQLTDLTRRQNVALLMVTHDLELAAKAQRIFTFQWKRTSSTFTESRCFECTPGSSSAKDTRAPR